MGWEISASARDTSWGEAIATGIRRPPEGLPWRDYHIFEEECNRSGGETQEHAMLCPWMNQLELWSMSEIGLTTVVNRELANYYQLVKLGSYFLFASYYVDGEINMQSLSLEI